MVNRTRIYILIVFALSIYLSTKNLGHYPFWDDEANTAFFARSLVNTGTLTAWDGKNFMAASNGWELDSNFENHVVAPVHYFTTALSFYLLGEGNWQGRLIHVLFGMGTLVLFLVLLRELQCSKRIIILAFTLLALSPHFMLYIRQCRYYGESLFLVALVYVLHLRVLNGNNKEGTTDKVLGSPKRHLALLWLALSSCLTILFLTHYYHYAALILALSVDFLSRSKKFTIRSISYHVSSYLPSLLVGGCYWFYFLRSYGNEFPHKGSNFLIFKVEQFWVVLRSLDFTTWAPTILIGLALLIEIGGTFFRDKLRLDRHRQLAMLPLLAFILVFIATVSFLNRTETTIPATGVSLDIRYMFPMLPLLVLAGVLSIEALARKRIWLMTPLAAITLSTNLFNLSIVKQNLNLYLFDYINEVHHQYPSPYQAVLDYLNQHTSKEENLFILPPAYSLPILYYAGSQYKICCQLKERPPFTRDRLPEFLFDDLSVPDLVIVFAAFGSLPAVYQYFNIQEDTHGVSYRIVELLNVYNVPLTRPEAFGRSFYPVPTNNNPTQMVQIYRKVPKALSNPTARSISPLRNHN